MKNLLFLLVIPPLFLSCKKEAKETTPEAGQAAQRSKPGSGGGYQTGPTPTLVDRYNGTGNKADQVRAMTMDAAGSFYVTGPSDGQGSEDYATVKYNAAGQRQWVARYNGPGNGDDWSTAIVVDANGDVYVTGRSTGASNSFDFATVKYNGATGAQVWTATYNGASNLHDVAQGVTVDLNGDVLVTGYANGGDYFFGNAIATIKYEALTGNQVWVRIYDELPDVSGDAEEGHSVVTDASGDVYVTGKSGASCFTMKYNHADGSSMWPAPAMIQGGNGRRILLDPFGNPIVASWGSLVVKYNAADGSQLNLGNPEVSDCAFQDMEIDADGNIYVTGWGRPGNNKDDYVTVKFNNSLQQQWSATYDGPYHGIDLVRALALDAAGNVYVTGRAEVPASRGSKVDYGTVKYDNNGNQQWAALYDAPDGSSDAFGLVVSSNGVFVSGQSPGKRTFLDFVTIKYQ